MSVSELGPLAVHVISNASPFRIFITSSLGEMLTSNAVGSESGATVAI